MNAQPRTRFEWPIYADATLAGLSVLIPVPFVDDAFEAFFRGRMPRRIARTRGRALAEGVEAELAERTGGWWAGSLALPIKLTVGLVKRLSRKVLYFVVVKEATDRLSYYWRRAFLLDHMLRAGHLETPGSAQIARRAMDQVLAETSGPLRQLAGHVVTHSRDVWQMLRRAREGQEDEALKETKGQLEERWGEAAGDLETLAARYEQAYRQIQLETSTGAG